MNMIANIILIIYNPSIMFLDTFNIITITEYKTSCTRVKKHCILYIRPGKTRN